MKRLIPFILMSLVALPSWGETMDDLVERDGIYYKRFSDEPFTGQVAGLARGTIKNGRIEGSWKKFYPSGDLHIDANYMNGVKHGSEIVWWINGNLHKKGTYENGKKVGTHVFYDIDGTLLSEWSGIFSNGRKISD